MTSITDAIATVVAQAHREHRASVEAAAQRLLVELGGAEQLLERASLHVRGEGREVVHELVLDGALVVWELAWDPRRRRWEPRWLVDVRRTQ